MSVTPKAAKELARVPVGVLLLRYSVPSIVGMLAMALYNVVDRLYVSHAVGPTGMAGFALTFPVTMVTVALGMLIGVGTTTRISIAMGQGKRRIARCYLGQAVCLYAILSLIIYPLIVAFFLDPILALTGGTPSSIPYAREYLQITLTGCITQYLCYALSNIMRAEGHPKKALCTMLLGAGTNLILDPFFIFDTVPLGFCEVPGLGWGIRGAAVATVLGQAAASAWNLIHFLRPSAALRLTFGYIKLYRPLIGGVFAVGLAPFALNLMGSIVNACYNALFKYWSPTEAIADREIAAIGIIITIQSIIVMPVFGFAQGMQPILGFSYGAKRYDRLRHTYSLALRLGAVYIFTCTCLTILFRRQIIGAFCNAADTGDLLLHGSHELGLFFGGFFFVGYAFIVSQYFQSIGKSLTSIILSFSRQAFMLLPLMLLLPYLLGPIGLWYASPISDTMAVTMALIFDILERRRLHRLEAALLSH